MTGRFQSNGSVQFESTKMRLIKATACIHLNGFYASMVVIINDPFYFILFFSNDDFNEMKPALELAGNITFRSL